KQKDNLTTLEKESLSSQVKTQTLILKKGWCSVINGAAPAMVVASKEVILLFCKGNIGYKSKSMADFKLLISCNDTSKKVKSYSYRGISSLRLRISRGQTVSD
ncbi:MAG TPA: hypothetical protein V6D07_14635, partial [Trichocoleus sp.]